MPVEKETTIESFDRFKTVDSYKQNVGSLTDANMAMIPVPVQHLELTKADTNLANLTPEGKTAIANWAQLDFDRAIPLKAELGNNPFRAPADGCLYAYVSLTQGFNSRMETQINHEAYYRFLTGYNSGSRIEHGGFLPTVKDAYCNITCFASSADVVKEFYAFFIPYRGVENA